MSNSISASAHLGVGRAEVSLPREVTHRHVRLPAAGVQLKLTRHVI